VRDDPNVAIRAILARPEFAHVRPQQAAVPSFVDRFVNWLSGVLTWFGDLLRRLFSHAYLDPGAAAMAVKTGRLLSSVLLVVVVAVALAAIAFAVYRIVVALARRRARREALAFGESALSEPQAVADLRAAALAAAQRGDYALAIALMFRAALSALDERALIGYDGARTPGEYRRLVRRTIAAAANAFDDLTVRFVRASYARTATTREDFDGAAGAYEAFAASASLP
jgi:hypothetical protein